MTTLIHHATQAKAAKVGVTLEVADLESGTETTIATWGKDHVVTHPTPKVALKLAMLIQRFGTEYPGVTVDLDPNVDPGDPDNHIVFVQEVGIVGFDPTDFDIDAMFADVLAECESEGIEFPEPEFDETGVVVPLKYKIEYAERGDRNHCGDWIAKRLVGEFQITEDGKTVFDADAFTEFLIANEVEMTGKWAALPTSGQKGWVGRYRMNGRQKLEKVITRRGTLVVDGKAEKVPMAYLEELLHKHPNVDAEWNQ